MPGDRNPTRRYAYHATSAKNLLGVIARGLMPGAAPSYGDRYSEYDDGHHLFFSDDVDYVRSFGVAVLRFPWPSDAKPDVNVYGRVLLHQFVSRQPVEPDQIEMEEAEGWWDPIAPMRRNPTRARARDAWTPGAKASTAFAPQYDKSPWAERQGERLGRVEVSGQSFTRPFREALREAHDLSARGAPKITLSIDTAPSFIEPEWHRFATVERGRLTSASPIYAVYYDTRIEIGETNPLYVVVRQSEGAEKAASYVTSQGIPDDMVKVKLLWPVWGNVGIPTAGRENPLLGYQSESKVSIGDRNLSPWEATAILGGILVVTGGALYLWLRSMTPAALTTSTTAPVAPVPAPAPVQPVPYSPDQPGY
ncbi:MAG: hypothetical protein ACLP1X_27080 [Polyangiaceae bacterium]